MKKAVFLLVCGCFAFGRNHNLILSFEEPVNLASLLAEHGVVSVRQLGQEPVYRVRMRNDLPPETLAAILGHLPHFQATEVDQKSGIGELEAAFLIDSRAMFLIDDIDSRAMFLIDEAGLDESEVPFAVLYTQYHVHDTRAYFAWPYTVGTRTVVAILDTGVDLEHPFLTDNLVPGYDFVDDDPFPDDEAANRDSNENGLADEGYGHGTHVAGIVKTVAPGVAIMPIRVADSDGQADLFDLVQGIGFAIANGAHVINLSLSVVEPSDLLRQWLDIARQFEIVVVTSAGNENSTELMFPATESEVITVASVGPTWEKSPFSNYSRKIDVAAPGEHIFSSHPDGAYVARSGTSMAAPIVSAQAALILDLVPGASVQYVSHRIKGTAYGIDYLNPAYRHFLGKGLVDVWNSITQNQQ